MEETTRKTMTIRELDELIKKLRKVPQKKMREDMEVNARWTMMNYPPIKEIIEALYRKGYKTNEIIDLIKANGGMEYGARSVRALDPKHATSSPEPMHEHQESE